MHGSSGRGGKKTTHKRSTHVVLTDVTSSAKGRHRGSRRSAYAPTTKRYSGGAARTRGFTRAEGARTRGTLLHRPPHVELTREQRQLARTLSRLYEGGKALSATSRGRQLALVRMYEGGQQHLLRKSPLGRFINKAAPLTEQSMALPGMHTAARSITDLSEMAIHSPGGLYLLATHPVRTAKQIPGQIVSDFSPGTLKRYPDRALVDLFAFGSAGAGAGARAGAVGRAFTRPAGELGRFGRTGAVAHAALTRPVPEPLRIHHNDASTTALPSENTLVRAGQRLRLHRTGGQVSSRRFAKELEQNQRVERAVSRGPDIALQRQGRKLSTPEQLAKQAIHEQTHPADLARYHRMRALKTSGREARRHEKLAAEWEQAAAHVVERPTTRPRAPAEVQAQIDALDHWYHDVVEKAREHYFGKTLDESNMRAEQARRNIVNGKIRKAQSGKDRLGRPKGSTGRYSGMKLMPTVKAEQWVEAERLLREHMAKLAAKDNPTATEFLDRVAAYDRLQEAQPLPGESWPKEILQHPVGRLTTDDPKLRAALARELHSMRRREATLTETGSLSPETMAARRVKPRGYVETALDPVKARVAIKEAQGKLAAVRQKLQVERDRVATLTKETDKREARRVVKDLEHEGVVLRRHLGRLRLDAETTAEHGPIRQLAPPRGYVGHAIEEPGRLTGPVRSFGGRVGSKMAKPGSLKEMHGGARREALTTTKVSETVAKRGLEATRIRDWLDTYEKIRDASVSHLPEGADPRNWVALMPVKKLSAEGKAALAKVLSGDVEVASDLTPTLQRLHHELIADAHAATEEAGVRFAERRIVKSLRPEIGGAPSTRLKRFADTVNQTVVTSFLYLGTKYLVTNLPGQEFLALTKMGLAQPLSIERTARLVKGLSAEDRASITEGIGGGLARSVVERGIAKNPVIGVSNKISRAFGLLLDTPWRWVGFTHEAFRRGYRTPEAVHRLLTSTDEKVVADRHVVFRTANEDYIDYERLGPFEREVMRRLVLFYPWLKGATRYAARYPVEHPIQAALSLKLGQQAEKKQAQAVGPLPTFAQGLIPVGVEDVPGLGKVPKVVDPTSAAIITQGPELVQAAVQLMGRGQGAGAGEFASPLLVALSASLARYDLSKGRALTGDIWNRLSQTTLGTSPPWTLATRLQGPRRTDVLYPRSRLEQIMRSIVAGGLYPGPLNPEKARKYWHDEISAQLSSTERVKFTSNLARHDLLAASKAKGISLGPQTKRALDLLEARNLARTQAASSAPSGKLTARQKFDVDLATARRMKLISPAQFTQWKREASGVPDESLRYFSSHTLSQLYGRHILTVAYRMLGLDPAKIPQLGG